MPKLKKNDIAERTRFMFDLFAKEPDTSIPRANKLMKQKFGSQMNSQKAYALRRSAIAQNHTKETAEAARAPMTLSGHPDLAIVATKSEGESELLARVFDELRNAGLCTLRVVHRRPDYVLVTNS